MTTKVSESVVTFCEAAFAEHGDCPAGLGWGSNNDADARHRTMLDVIRDEGQPTTLLDFGCGTSQLYEYIQRERLDWISYSGLDLSNRFLDLSRRKFPLVQYYDVDVLAPAAPKLPPFDYVILSGLWTYKGEASALETFENLRALIRCTFDIATTGIAFNVMSKEVDWERSDLFHVPVDTLLGFLSREISRHVVVRHDYGLYEYTAYVYKEATPRRHGVLPRISKLR